VNSERPALSKHLAVERVKGKRPAKPRHPWSAGSLARPTVGKIRNSRKNLSDRRLGEGKAQKGDFGNGSASAKPMTRQVTNLIALEQGRRTSKYPYPRKSVFIRGCFFRVHSWSLFASIRGPALREILSAQNWNLTGPCSDPLEMIASNCL
jgi:hypothetical protein